jgi:hypothetical protein
MSRWLMLATVCALTACGGEDSGGEGMAQEVGGTCVFTPGAYVVSYDVIDASESCGDVEAYQDEFLTVGNSGTLVSTGAGAPQSCTDGAPAVDGCFVAFTRSCDIPVSGGHTVASIEFQYDYAEGDGHVRTSMRILSGETLIGACNVNEQATIQRL